MHNNSTSKCSYFGGQLAGYLLCGTVCRQEFGGDCSRINRIHIPRWHESASFLNVESESKHRIRNCTIERGNSFEILDFYMTHHLHLEFRFQTVHSRCHVRIGAFVKGHSPLGTQGCPTTGASGRAGGRRFWAWHAAGAVLPTRWSDRGSGDSPWSGPVYYVSR